MDLTEDNILELLATVIDPELGVNIVDLGLVYEVEVKDGEVLISMTMTTAACPMAAHLVDQVSEAVADKFPMPGRAHIQLVWEPAWDPLMMSWKARNALGWG